MIGRFHGKDITKFLRAYIYEMEVHQVPENTMMEAFPLDVIPEIREKVQELHGQTTLWSRFEERLKDEYFDEGSE